LSASEVPTRSGSPSSSMAPDPPKAWENDD
jgi:hypothetical protein